jgi:hypothetical protein
MGFHMIHKIEVQHIVLHGNVIEIFNDNEKPCLKILLKPDCIQTNIENIEEFHLGDDVDVYCDIKINEIKPAIGSLDK